jgi:NAD(P)-dependent dehydrogenase (short-subunit alcohol dehydrogenase family)
MQMLSQAPVNEVRGRIINISSQHGMVACPGDFPYSVSKGGTVQMTRQIAVDHANDMIVCNAIAPGKIITGKPGVANDPDALDYSRHPERCGRSCTVPCQRHGKLHHRHQPDGGRRLDGGLTDEGIRAQPLAYSLSFQAQCDAVIGS